MYLQIEETKHCWTYTFNSRFRKSCSPIHFISI